MMLFKTSQNLAATALLQITSMLLLRVSMAEWQLPQEKIGNLRHLSLDNQLVIPIAHVKLLSAFFIQKEVAYLGYLLTIGGWKPQPSKTEAIHRIISSG